MSSIKYRADVDGLRALAVLAVLVYHAWPRWLPGGFIGVDIFFVISGYLISAIVYKGCRERTFTFADFYARRVRRIFPALIAMLAICLAYGWLVLLPAEFRQLGGHAAAGTVFLQNIAFWRETGYFDTDSALKPLLHLWSLAVEEQIYLIFPPLVLLAMRMRWPVLPLLVALLAASFVANLYESRRSISADFFLTPYRAWEFLAGAILAWVHDRRGPPRRTSWLAEGAACGGLVLLAGGLRWIEHGATFPGWLALVPVAGTTLLIGAGQHAAINRLVLSFRPVVWLGLISYPLYLFHWPILSFVRIVKGPEADQPIVAAAAVGVGGVLALAVYYGLERTIRHSRSPWAVPALLAAFLGVGGLGLGAWTGRLPPRPASPEIRRVDEAIAEARSGWNQYNDGYRVRSDRGIDVWRCGGTGGQTLFFGDSTMVMYAPRIRRLLEEGGGDRGAVIVARGGCCPVPGVARADVAHEEDLVPVFEGELASNPAIDRVVIAASWGMYVMYSRSTIDGLPTDSEPGFKKLLDAFGDLITRCKEAGKSVTVVLAVPGDHALDPNKMQARSLSGGRVLRVRPYSVEAWRRRNRGRIEELAAVARAHGAEVIDPVPSLSHEGICTAVDENGPIRSDAWHLRRAFVRDRVTFLDQTVGGTTGERPDARHRESL